MQNQAAEGWGSKVVERLAADLRLDFPDMKSFSVRNLNYMRKFAAGYPDFAFVQTVSAQISWSHHTILLDRFEEPNLRLWYAEKSAEQGWSKRVLMHQIDLK